MFWTVFIPASALLSTLGFYLFWKRRPQAYTKVELEQKRDNPQALKFELLWTIGSIATFALIGLGMDLLIGKGYTSLLPKWSSADWWYHPISLLLALALHDIYFYWSHRLLHTPLIYKGVHAVHHYSESPNPLVAFSMHPLESLVQLGIVPLVALTIPIHEVTLVIFTGFLCFMSVYGHCGYELRAKKKGIWNMFNTSLHHYQHHQYYRCNYGIYLNIWDRWFKTNHHSYDKEKDRLARL